MIDTAALYGLAGIGLAALGLRATLLQTHIMRKILALNVTGVGIFLVLVATAYRGPDLAADPVPHALVLTGIVVAVSATALGVALERRRRRNDHDV